MISTVAISSYGAWLSVPTTTSIHNIYERYVAREESRPRIFDEGIVVRLDREAPPVAALEEALRDQPWAAIERTPGFEVRPIELRAAPAAAERVAIRILSDNEQFNRRLLQRQMHDRQIEARVLTTPIAPPIGPEDRYPRDRMRSANGSGRGGASFVAGAANSHPRRIEVLNPSTVDSEVPQPTASVAISTSKTGLTRERILAALFGPIAQPLKPSPSPTLWGNSNSTGSKPAAASRGSNTPAPAEKNETVVAKSDTSESPGIVSMGMFAPRGRQIMIRGPIELAGGLALTHAKDRIAVLRESRGQFVESGAVWIREARYEIFVESLEGQLVAEVRSPQGEVVGRGKIELASLALASAAKDAKNSLDGITLKVVPVIPGIAGTVQSAYSSGSTSKGVHGARVDLENTMSSMKTVSGGHFEDTRFTEGSRVIANVQTKGHWPTLAMLTSGQETVVPVYSRKMMNAFVSLTSKDESTAESLIKTKGVIWGRVTRGGQTVSGAQIDVVTRGAGEPIYFNELMLPDANMTSTGTNGLFAVPAVSTGAHAVQVRIGKRLSDPVFVRAEVQSVASLDLDVLKASEFQARAFDAFRTNWPLRAELRPMGHIRSRKMIVEGEDGSVVTLANLGMPTILEVDGGSEYLATRMVQNPNTRNLYLPMVERAWFDRVLGRMKYNNLPRTGNVVGFIQGSRFRVSMDAKSLASNAKVVYFDSSGEITSREYGEPGGGFILLGVENGLQTVIIDAEGGDRVHAATVLIEEGYVASLSHWLR